MRDAVIIGAGPAGLTAALELLRRTGLRPVVLEQLDQVGGLARTTVHRGNRIDIGGHRFFTKSDRVMSWWLEILPTEPASGDVPAAGIDPERVMLVRKRRSRIYFRGTLVDYPLRLNARTLGSLGVRATARILASYAWSTAFPIRQPANLEEFLTNRFGRELYRTFFKTYTEKVWGVPCHRISAEWGEQRVKDLSVGRVVAQWARGLVPRRETIEQRGTDTSLIERFLYPKYGPGQMWEVVAERVLAMGGEVLTGFVADKIRVRGSRIVAVEAARRGTGERRSFEADVVFSCMPVPDLVRALDAPVPDAVREVADGLMFRDFLTVGLLVRDLALRDENQARVEDTWLYVQEPGVLAGRVQVFNNWSPALVRDPSTVWIGVEYFCREGDELWSRPDAALVEFAAAEMRRIGVVGSERVLDGTVLRAPRAYPAYFGTYARFAELRSFLDRFENLYPVGRNGMHRYDNQDHAMLCSMIAVDNIVDGRSDRSNLWAVNTEKEYHEERSDPGGLP
jgi:protoporphyrinogen oxidase